MSDVNSSIKSINPFNLEKIGEYELFSNEKVDGIINSAQDCFKEYWSKTDFQAREKLFLKLEKNLIESKDDLAELISNEMGKLKSESLSEIKKCASLCSFYAKSGGEFLSDEIIESEYESSYITYKPLGVVLAVMPWNFPFWQVFRFAVPTLLAGNTVLLKHASNVTGSALKIQELFKNAGFPEFSFNTLIIKSDSVKRIIENKFVKAVSLTGSEPAGRSVAKVAGENLKKAVLELGGNDPYVILPDVDIDSVIKTCIKGRLVNCGQSCISPKRLIIHEDIYDTFKHKLLTALEKIEFSDPLNESNNSKESLLLTPLNSVEARDNLHETISKAIDEGGVDCILGGKIPEDKKGAFYPMTVLENISESSKIFDEELFGPTLCLYKAKDIDHAINLSNNSSFGLGGAVFSKDINLAEKIARDNISTGSCFVNDFVKSNQKLPFGGVRNSGYGRELSFLGIREFTNIKTIAIKKN